MDGQLSLTGEPVEPRRLSVTALVDLRRCPRRFSFCHLEGHGRRQPSGAALGAAVHRAIERVHRGGKTDDGADETPYVDAFRRSTFAGRRLVAAELPVRLRRAGFVIAGRVDAVFAGEDGDDAWEIVDWKTGGAPAQPDAADDAQLEVYALVAIEQYGRDPSKLATSYLHLATGEIRRRKWSTAVVEVAEARLAADLHRIDEADLPAVPNRTCPGCDALPVCPPGLERVAALEGLP